MTERLAPGRAEPRSESAPGRTLFAADWVVPVTSPPIAEGGVLVEGSRIVEVGRAQDLQKVGLDETRELAGHLLLPGLVNAHTHLEISFLRGRLSPGMAFDAWIEAMVESMLGADEESFTEAVRSGIREVISNGMTAVGDISRAGRSHQLLSEMGLKGTVFVELLGFHTDQEAKALEGAAGELERLASRPKETLRIGISPHAPYSTSPGLYRASTDLARRKNLPLAVHLAETTEEERFIREGRGPLRDLLERFGVWDEAFPIPRCSPVAYLEQLGVLAGALAVHCNTVDDEEDIRLLKGAGARVVLCPGSNAWFGRLGRHPVARLLEAGVPCSLGTDSLASNDRLDVLAEMSLLASAHPEIPPETILHMATDWAAEALGLAGVCGSLKAGGAADLVALRLPSGGAQEPISWAVADAMGADVALVVIDGAVAHQASEA